MCKLAIILALVLHVAAGERINDALNEARVAYAERGETTTICIAPGTYYEELTIDIPGIRLINSAAITSEAITSAQRITVSNGGVTIGENAVRLSWHYGHGYQYASMGPNRPNYGGSKERRWNASVLVTAPDFYAEGIIFENSFNLYVSPLEAQDTLVDLSDAPFEWSAKERPKRRMPDRPKTPYSTEVQTRFYRERASALSFTETATNAHLVNCRVVGRQDALYGDHGARVLIENSILCGAVDYIFGGMDLEVRNSELVAMVGEEKGDKCYIAAGRGFYGLRFYHCTVRFATEDELVRPGTEPIRLCRPWRWWGVHVFAGTQAAEGVMHPERVSLGLTKGHQTPFVYIY